MARTSERARLLAELYRSVDRMNKALETGQRDVVLDELAKQTDLRRQFERTEEPD